MQRELEDQLSEQILFGELKPGSIVVVDVEGEGVDATFTFKSEPRATLPDLPDHPDLQAIETVDSGDVGEAGPTASVEE
jgi:ATP-dependent Clp protease ATP-binding subunit ClpC